MRKKDKIWLMLFAVSLLILAGFIPDLVLSSVPTTEVILPVKNTYTPYVSCQGVIKDNARTEVYSTTPLMIEKVLVKQGDWVNKGDVLAVVDTATSCALMESAAVGQNDTTSGIEYYRELAKQYGMEDQLEAYLSQNLSENTAPKTNKSIQNYIVADQNGYILELNMHSRCLNNVGDLLYSSSNGDDYSAVLRVEEAAIAKIEIGDPILLTGPSFENNEVKAIVSAISPVVTQVFSGLESKLVVEVEATLLGNHQNIRPNMSVSAKIATEKPKVCLSVPYEAVSQDEKNREFVIKIEDGKAQRCYIDVENELSNNIQLADGITNGVPIVYEAENFHDKSVFKIAYRENWHG